MVKNKMSRFLWFTVYIACFIAHALAFGSLRDRYSDVNQ